MPIKPENRGRYPANWKVIRAAILARAGHRCERCGVQNRTRVARGAGIDAGTFMTADARVWDADTGREVGPRRPGDYEVGSMVEIVLTIAHLDHVPENCDPDNLLALCQRCHLRQDAEHHARNARETRRAGKAVGDLFGSAAAAGPVHAVPDPDDQVLGLAEAVAERDLEAAVDQAVGEARAAGGRGCGGAGRRGERDGAGGGDFDHGQLSPLPMVVPRTDMGSRSGSVKACAGVIPGDGLAADAIPTAVPTADAGGGDGGGC